MGIFYTVREMFYFRVLLYDFYGVVSFYDNRFLRKKLEKDIIDTEDYFFTLGIVFFL